MKLRTFKGGIHPDECKKSTEDHGIIDIQPQSELVFPMQQHIGKPAIPTVKKGDEVLTGQIIGEAQGFISANIISSVSGKVKAVEDRLTVNGSNCLSVVIESDGQYNKIEGFGEKRDYNSLSSAEIREIIRSAGIVGLGGAGFPTHVKLTPKDDNAIEYVVINACECEPFLTSDYRIMMESPDKIIGGINIILKLFPNAKAIIGIEDNKPEAIEKLKKASEKFSNIEVAKLKTKYPQGGEKFLLYAVTGRKFNSKMIPSDVGAIIINSTTTAAVYDAVVNSTPLVSAVVTLAGDEIKSPANYRVPLGTSYADVLEAAGGFDENIPVKLVLGGPMMGVAQYTLEVPVTKTASGLLAFEHDDVAECETTSCIHCGRCVQVCPGNVIPMKMMVMAQHHDLDGFLKLNGMECCECGCCTYVCPAKLGLTQAFKQMKKWAIDSGKR